MMFLLLPDLRSFSRLVLNFPLRFFGVGLFMICWSIIMFSSRSTNSISRAANSSSRFCRNSSCNFCWRAARFSSSSLVLSSYTKPTNHQVTSTWSESQKYTTNQKSYPCTWIEEKYPHPTIIYRMGKNFNITTRHEPAECDTAAHKLQSFTCSLSIDHK